MYGEADTDIVPVSISKRVRAPREPVSTGLRPVDSCRVNLRGGLPRGVGFHIRREYVGFRG